MTYPAQKTKVRVFTWIILGLNIIWLVLLIVQLANLGHPVSDCKTLSQSTCTAAKNIGTTIGAGLIIGLWVAMDVILGILWIVTRKRQPQIIYMNGALPVVPAYEAPVVVPARAVASYQVSAAAAPPSVPAASSAATSAPTRPFANSGGQRSGSGPGSLDIAVPKDQQMAFTCGGTWGRTVLIADGQVLVDVTGAHSAYRIIRASAQPVHFDVDTDGTWTIYLRKATRSESRST